MFMCTPQHLSDVDYTLKTFTFGDYPSRWLHMLLVLSGIQRLDSRAFTFFENLLKYSGGLWVVESCTIWVWVKIRYPNNWMVNTKLDISICGPLGLPFWPTSICWWFSSISPAWSRCSWRPWFYQVHQWESTRCWSGLTVPSSMLWWTRMDTYRHVGPPFDS